MGHWIGGVPELLGLGPPNVQDLKQLCSLETIVSCRFWLFPCYAVLTNLSITAYISLFNTAELCVTDLTMLGFEPAFVRAGLWCDHKSTATATFFLCLGHMHIRASGFYLLWFFLKFLTNYDITLLFNCVSSSKTVFWCGLSEDNT